MSPKRFWLAGFLVGALAACQPSITPISVSPTSPPPTQAVIQVELTPALAPWMRMLKECSLESVSSQASGFGLTIQERPAAALSPEAGIALRIGASQSTPMTASLVGYEELVLITHLTNPITQLEFESLVEIYSGSLRTWEEVSPTGSFGEAIQPWSYDTGDDLREGFESAVLQGKPIHLSVHQAPDPAAMLEAVREHPGAVGFIPGSWVDSTTRSIRITGGQADGITLPVVALTAGEPQGPIRQLIGCLQAEPVPTP